MEEFNIQNEINKLIGIINDETFDNNKEFVIMTSIDQRLAYLFNVLMLTKKYPQVETYLQQLLTNFTLDELENLSGKNDNSILHEMSFCTNKISYNAYEIIINFGVDINKKNNTHATAISILYMIPKHNDWTDHHTNISNLFIKSGVDLNMRLYSNITLLEIVIAHTYLNNKMKDAIMVLIDAGAKSYNINKNINTNNNEILKFIESYTHSSIKLAIKK